MSRWAAAEAPPRLRTFEPAAAVAHPDGWTAFEWPATGADPHDLVALRLPVRPRAGEPYLREGWQSWSTPVPARVGDGLRRVAGTGPPRAGRRHWLLDPPYRGDESYGIWRSASATAYVDRAQAVFAATGDGLLAVREEPADGGHPAVWLSPRAATAGELAARLARPLRAAAAHTGWSTWDVHGPDLNGEDLQDDLAAIERRLGESVQVVNVDDGWQRAIGDWVPRDRAMAHALGAVAGRRRVSLWWAPFVVHRESALAERHPGWVLRDRDGLPVVVLARDEPWEAWALDLSHPDVVAWLEATAATLVGYGAGLLKTDFLYASAYTGDAARAGTCADPSLTGEQAHRRALAAIAASGAAITGCGAPLCSSAGLVDLMRVGPDVGRCWWRPPAAGLEPEHASGCLVNAWAAARRRAWMDGALWRNDPDSVFLRGGPRVDAWLDWVAVRGLPLVLGDPVRGLSRAECRRWTRAVERWEAAAG